MEIDVKAVAEMLGVTDRRVRQLIESGDLPARRAGGRLLVEESLLPRSRPKTRPMSARIAWAFIDLLSGERPTGLSGSERARLREKLRMLLASPQPAEQLRSWLRMRDQVLRLSVAPPDVGAVRKDGRLVLSGISDGRSQLSAGDEVEGYVHPGDVASLKADYLMAESRRVNVWLHVVERPIPHPAPLGLVIADLAGHNGPREDARVREMLQRARW